MKFHIIGNKYILFLIVDIKKNAFNNHKERFTSLCEKNVK